MLIFLLVLLGVAAVVWSWFYVWYVLGNKQRHTTCAECDAYMYDYLNGEVGHEREAAIERHIDGCRRCRLQLEAAKATMREKM